MDTDNPRQATFERRLIVLSEMCEKKDESIWILYYSIRQQDAPLWRKQRHSPRCPKNLLEHPKLHHERGSSTATKVDNQRSPRFWKSNSFITFSSFISTSCKLGATLPTKAERWKISVKWFLICVWRVFVENVYDTPFPNSKHPGG